MQLSIHGDAMLELKYRGIGIYLVAHKEVEYFIFIIYTLYITHMQKTTITNRPYVLMQLIKNVRLDCPYKPTSHGPILLVELIVSWTNK